MNRGTQETATRISCYMDWVASQYGMKAESSKFEVKCDYCKLNQAVFELGQAKIKVVNDKFMFKTV